MVQPVWKVPVRVDFSGGTLDLWPIYSILGDTNTVNAALDLFIEIQYESGTQQYQLEDLNTSQKSISSTWFFTPPPHLSWVHRVLNHFQPTPCRVSIHSPVPRGSGLGASSALGVGLWAALSESPILRVEDIVALRDLESAELRTPAGLQDYFPAAYGGVLNLSWETQPRIQRLTPVSTLNEGLIIFDTGVMHHSGLTNWEAYRRFMDNDGPTVEALQSIKVISSEIKDAIQEDLLRFALLVEREGQQRKRIAPGIEVALLDQVRQAGQKAGWYWGMKPCGAGGGGCALLIVDPERRSEALDYFKIMNIAVISACITDQGVHLKGIE